MHRSIALSLVVVFTGACAVQQPRLPDLSQKPWSFDHGGVTRGDTSEKKLALIFTGGDFDLHR